MLLFDLCTEDIFSSVFLAVYFLSFSLYTASANEQWLCLQFILSDDRSYRLGKNSRIFHSFMETLFRANKSTWSYRKICTESIFQYSSILSCSFIKEGFVTRCRNGSAIFTMDDKFEKRSHLRFLFWCSANLLSRHTKLFVIVLKRFSFYFLIQSHIFSCFFIFNFWFQFLPPPRTVHLRFGALMSCKSISDSNFADSLETACS